MFYQKCTKCAIIIMETEGKCFRYVEVVMSVKIIIVDDDEITRKSLSEILRHEGYDVTTVDDGELALEILEAEEIDLMLLDIRMPGMDGIEVMRRVEEISPDTQIVMLTGHGTMETAIEALRYEAHDYLLKPPSRQEILSSVASGLARRDEEKRKRILLGQIENSLQQLKDVEGITAPPKPKRQVIALPDGVTLDLARREMWRGSNKERLTPTEGRLLEVFVTNWGRVLSHSELVFFVQGYEVAEWEAPEVLRPLISRLRRKLGIFPNGEKWISSVRGTGYVFDAEKPN
jgi:DNA-binding response OmpR family regulator